MIRKKQNPPISLLNKNTVILSTLIILLVITVSITFAYLNSQSSASINLFHVGNINCSVIETMENDTKSNVRIENTGNATAYVRVAVIANFSGESLQKVKGESPVKDTDYTIEWADNFDNNWFKLGHYYYCKQPLAANTQSAQLIKTAVPLHPANEQKIQINILGEAIQAKPVSAVQEAWPVTVAEDGSLEAGTNSP